MKDIPDLNPLEITVVVAGVPNVGKSMLVKALSSANPEVAVYPFTTKGVTIGHLLIGRRRMQIMDIPGLLDRPAEKRNDIELKGVAALEKAADMVIFIMDPSETCGYDMDAQRNLFSEISELGEYITILVSNKTDIAEPVEGSIPISALEGTGIQELIGELGTLMEDLPKKCHDPIEEIRST